MWGGGVAYRTVDEEVQCVYLLAMHSASVSWHPHSPDSASKGTELRHTLNLYQRGESEPCSLPQALTVPLGTCQGQM